MRGYLGDLAVDHAREFVNDDCAVGFDQAPRELDAEPFAVAQHRIGAKP
jgi:hypothetical protein